MHGFTAIQQMHDWVIMAGTALVGGLILDLQKRTTSRQQLLAGLFMVPFGWIAALAMTASGPFPSRVGAGIGMGILLAGIALLSLPAMRAARTRRNPDNSRKA